MVMISGYKTNKGSSNVIHHRVWIDATRYIIFKFVKSTHDCLHWKLSFLMKLCLFPVHFGCRFFYRKINLIKTAHGTKFITPFAYASRWIKAIKKKGFKVSSTEVVLHSLLLFAFITISLYNFDNVLILLTAMHSWYQCSFWQNLESTWRQDSDHIFLGDPFLCKLHKNHLDISQLSLDILDHWGR